MSRRPDDDYILEKIKSYGDDNFYRYVEMAFYYYKQDVREGKDWIKANLPDLIRLDKEKKKLRAALKPFVVDDWVEYATFTGSHLRDAAAAYKETSDADT